MSECLCFGNDQPSFPQKPENRPGLDRIAYRIATYPAFRAAMLRQLNLQPELANWTHREPDDPGIALLEGAAIVGDILTFYQDVYANEAYLRTAQWRESVAELVRLLGYRLAPGLGGEGAFAFEIKGTKPVTIPAGFGVQADLQDSTQPAQFETTSELLAYPHLSRFHLYRPATHAASVSAGSTQLELSAVAGSGSAAALASAGLKVGDRLMLVPGESMWSANTTFSGQAEPQLVKITKISQSLNRTVLKFDGGLVSPWTAPVRAYRVGRTFRHFGHNAPPKIVSNQTDSSGKITGATQSNAVFLRHFDWECGDASMSVALPETTMPLDQEVNDLSLGGTLIIRAQVQFKNHTALEPLVVARKITALRAGNLGWGNLNGQATFVTLNAKLVTNTSAPEAQGDIRDVQFQEVTSPVLHLRPVASFAQGAQTTATLQFFGTHSEVSALAGRRLLFQHRDGRSLDLTCTDAASAFTKPAGDDPPKLWTIHLSRPLTGFLKQDFDEQVPNVTVFGNVASATQGKSEREAVLGSGDSRQTFQTFKLPKAPLTYHLSGGSTPPESPELEVRVQGRLWQRVISFFGHSGQEEIYIVREDVNGESHVQFGDGDNGARLPSGLNNVSARFRSGSGARGLLKAGAKVSPIGRLDGVEKIQLPGVISGGADPETMDKAREAAPGKIQSLGRLVSLRDFETETLSIPSVSKVAAAWALDGGVPTVQLRVLLEAGRASETDAVKQAIVEQQHCRGPNRFPVHVVHGSLRYVYLELHYAFDPRLERAAVENEIRSALGVGDDPAAQRSGLFAVGPRHFGEREYMTRIIGRVQNVPGVRWCKVTAFGLLPAGENPALLVVPSDPKPLNATVASGEAEVLQLAPIHLGLTAAAAPATDPCES